VIEVNWNGNGDVDLIVVEPGGAAANWMNTHTAFGGVHLRDGYGPKQENCYEKYVCTQAQSGRYLIRVSHVWGKIVAGKVRVKVTKHQGAPSESSQVHTVTLGEEDQLVQITLDNGRRENPNPALEENRQSQLEFWNPQRQAVTGLSPYRLNPQQQEVLRQFLGPGNQLGASPIIPGVVANAPLITPVISGTTFGTGAIVSADRRYVRIGIDAAFSELVDVIQFSLSGGAQSSTTPNGN
jgi:hypothetical protein